MKLGSIKFERDGKLVVVSQDLTRACYVQHIASTLQQALDHWTDVKIKLIKIYNDLNHHLITDSFYLNINELTSPLPRAYQWVDGSAFLNHVNLVRKARGAEMPENFYYDPLMYQGASDSFIGPTDPILMASEEWGIDFESEVAVITDDVPMGVSSEGAKDHIQLLMLVNDVSLRHLIPQELAKGFGFLHGKPTTAFSPVAVTPDELGVAWEDCKIHLPLQTYLNGQLFGKPNAGKDMNFNFAQLISHAAKTRVLSAGTIVGSGTVSNEDATQGFSCIAEKRMIEKIEVGDAKTSFLSFGDRIRIEMVDDKKQNIFGSINQVVKKYIKPFSKHDV